MHHYFIILFFVLSSSYHLQPFRSLGLAHPKLREASCSASPGATGRPLKVLVVVEPSPFSYVSGYTNRFQEMLKFMKEAGDEVHIITPTKLADPPVEFCGFPITSIGGYSLPLYEDVVLSFGCRKIRDTIKSFQPDVIHVSTPGTLVYRTIVAAKREKVPLVMSYHTHLPAYARKFIPLPGISRLANFVVRWTHSWADLTLVTSPELKREMDAIGVRRTAVWEKGVNTQMFSPEFRSNDTRTLLSQGSVNPLILGYVGRLSVEKNLDLLKDVMDKIEQHKSLSAANESLVFPDVHLVFVGTGPAENQLKDIFKGYNNVHFAGQLLGPALSSAFASIDIFVMPSESETLGFVVLEALASRVPAVAVRAGGIAGIIEHNVTGLLSAATGGADATEFANNVIYLIKNSDRRHHMGLLGRQYAEKLSWRTATEKLRRIQYPASINLKRTVGRGWLRDSRNLTAEKLVLESMRCEEFEFDLDH